MLPVLAFLCRLLVFEVLSLVSTFVAQEMVLSLYERVLVSSVQVLIFCMMWGVWRAVSFLLSALQEANMYGKLQHVSRRSSWDEENLVAHELDASTLEMPVSEETLQLDGVTEQEVTEALDEEIMSTITQHTQNSSQSRLIVFTSRKALREHVQQVYILGCLLWGTLLCLDFSLLSVTLFFVLGLYVAWVKRLCWTARVSTSSVCVQVVYVLLLGALMGLCLHTHRASWVPEEHFISRQMLLSNVLPAVIGFVWIEVPSKDLVQKVTQSTFTCVLLCLPVVVTISYDLLRDLWRLESELVLVWLFLIEPPLKALAVFVIALALQTGRRTEMVLVLALAVHMNEASLLDVDDAMRIVTVMLMLLTLIMHVCVLCAAGPY